MNKRLKLISLILVLATLMTLMMSIASAASEAEENSGAATATTPVATAEGDGDTELDFKDMGFDFHTDDPNYPKFKVIAADGTETVYYDEYMLRKVTQGYGDPPRDDGTQAPDGTETPDGTENPDDSDGAVDEEAPMKPSEGETIYIPPIADGSTIVLMSDLYYPNLGDSGTAWYNVYVAGEKTVNLDMAGYTVLAEHKSTFISAYSRATVNVYSSKPGAKFIGVTHQTKGSAVVYGGSSSTVNFGAYGDYPGSNITTYSAAACNVYGSSTVNFVGCDMYRMANDWTAYYCFRSSHGRLNLDGVRAFGIVRDLQFRVASSAAGRDNIATIKNSYMANIGMTGSTTGHFFTFMTDGNEFHFENTSFNRVSMTFDLKQYNKVDDGITPRALVTIDKFCSFSKLPDPSTCHEIFQFPDIAYIPDVPKKEQYLYVNGTAQNIEYFIPYNASETPGGRTDYTMADHEEDVVSAPYAFVCKGYEEETVELTWDFNGTYTTQLWRKEAEPYPHDMDIPKNSKYVRYDISEPVTGEDYVIYSIYPRLYLDFYYNFTFTNTFNVNFYIPVLEDMSTENLVAGALVGPNTIKKSTIFESEIVTVDGKQYYKVVSEIPYDKVTDNINVSVDIYGKNKFKKLFTASKKIKLPDEMQGFLDGDYDDAFKAKVKGVLYAIKDARKKESTALSGIYAIIKERFETEPPKEE